MVASPWVGTKLDEEQVIGIVKKWGHARVIESRRRALIGGGVAAGMACLILGAGILVWPDSKSRNRGLELIEEGQDKSLPSAPAVGTLYVLTVGISTYRDSSYNLPCAGRMPNRFTSCSLSLVGNGLSRRWSALIP